MLQKVKSYIKTNELLTPGDKVILGVSGGADSVALLLVLSELKKELDLDLYAVHVNHGLRGEEAERDRDFTEKLCERLSVPLTVFCEDVAGIAKEEGISCEEAGRRVRYKAFEAVAAETCAKKIAVAHHMDDNAETLVFRMARGTGLKGLTGILPKRNLTQEIILIRPFLCVKRAEIENWLAERGQDYCTDSTNLTDEFSRNSIRNTVIPLLEKLNSGAVDNICALAEQVSRTEEYLSRVTESLYGQCVEFGSTRNALLVRIPENAEPVLFERILRSALFKVAEHEKDITANHIRLLAELAKKQTGSRLSLPYGVTAEKSYDCILLTKENSDYSEAAAYIPEDTVINPHLLTGGEKVVVNVLSYGSFHFSLVENDEKIQINSKEDYTKYFDYDKMSGKIELRRAREGDTLALGASGGTKDIKKLFTDCKVPKAERDRIPVIAEGNNVLWIPGVRTGENRRIDNTSKRILKIEWRTLW